MERFYGFDLGDAESSIARINAKNQQIPQVLTVADQKSFVTAYALLRNGDLKIGENACYEAEAEMRKVRFKSRFLTDHRVENDVKRFAAGVLGQLYGNGDLVKNEDTCFYIGCPAGWNRNSRERYRKIFEDVGFPPAKIVSESRAALVSACQSRHLQVGYNILSKPILVVDIGSSTLDFAYVCNGHEMDIQTAGEVLLGGGIMDELLLEECVSQSDQTDRIRQVFAESDAWHSYCEFAARRLKEQYFAEEDYWETHACRKELLIRYDKPIRLTLEMDKKRADLLLNKKVEKLDNRSFQEVFLASLENVRQHITGETPDLIFLTGGVSRLPAIRTWCEDAFPDAVVICGAEPEFSVSKGLAWCGKIDEELRSFRQEVEELKRSPVVENIVAERIHQLYRKTVDTLVEPIIQNAAVPVYEKWRKGEITLLKEVDREMQTEVEAFLRTEQAKKLLVKPITEWLKPVSDKLEEYTLPICLKYNVPYEAMSLKSYLEISDLDIRLEAKSLFAVEEITWLIDSLISILVGLLCGGSGIALIAGGFPGIIIGFIASFLLLALGKHRMEETLLHVNIPKPIRKLLPKNLYKLRQDGILSLVKENLYDSLENEKNDIITKRMVDEISAQIEKCLTDMAEIVEIPL